MKSYSDILREKFLMRLEEDNFDLLGIEDVPTSIHEFVDFFTAGNAIFSKHGLGTVLSFPDLTDLTITFGEFLSRPFKFHNRTLTVETWFKEHFCTAIVNGLARNSEVSAQANGLFSGMDLTQRREWIEAFIQTPEITKLANEFGDIAVEKFKTKQLISFFVLTPEPGSFALWGPGAVSGEGRKLPTKTISESGYAVSVAVSRYDEPEGLVSAYEWSATLTLEGQTEPDAACCGMVYVFDRDDGVPTGGLNDLILASDSMADTDVMQVKAFIDQQPDARAIITQSDISFVWLWDRRTGSEPGLGAKCIRAALNDLKRRFKKMNTVIFDARPAQFANWSSRIDPPMVGIEKQAAIESLVSYIQGLNLEFDVRAIFTRTDNPQLESLIELGRALENNEQNDDDESGIDFERFDGEIVHLLRKAGLDELAQDFEDDVGTDEDITLALKSIIFDSCLHYLRPTISEYFNPEDIDFNSSIQLEDAREEIFSLDQFVDDLPEWMTIESVFDINGLIVCKVVAKTPIGSLTDYFTTIPKPKPVYVEQFFRNLE